MNWSRGHTLAVGAALILAVNGLALVGVAYNRSGDPASMLRLSERELRPPDAWGLQTENSGLSLKVLWRLLSPDTEKRGIYYDFAGMSADAGWLDGGKLTELGFDASRPSATTAEKRHYEKLRSKEVLLVLELAGSTYQAALNVAHQRAANQRTAAAANPGNSNLKTQAENAEKQLEHEEHNSSRLFVVDAGLEAAGLRAKYPDRSRHAIVHGRVRPRLLGDSARVSGYVEALSIDSVNVPVELRPVFDGVPARTYPFGQRYTGPTYEAAVAFGKRLEPWLTSAMRKP